jgi:DNA-binding MarR family transcriptional regulator
MSKRKTRIDLAVEAALLLKRVQHQKSLAVDGVLVRQGSSMAQWTALRTIAENPDLNSHALAALAFQTDQSFGALLSKLASLGLIERVPGARKSLTHSLTSEGEALLSSSSPTVQQELERQLAPLDDDDLRSLIRLLTKLAVATDGDGSPQRNPDAQDKPNR